MPFLSVFYPNEKYPSLNDVDYEGLWQKGIRYLIFDIDETLIPREENTVQPSLIAFIERLKSLGFKIFLLSNSRHPLRVKYFAEILGLPSAHLSFKPLPFGFWKALKELQAEAASTAMIGDQLFMDILGGNLAGLYTIFVKPRSPETIEWRIWMRKLENRILGEF